MVAPRRADFGDGPAGDEGDTLGGARVGEAVLAITVGLDVAVMLEE